MYKVFAPCNEIMMFHWPHLNLKDHLKQNHIGKMESKTSVTNLKLNHLKIKANVYKGIVLVVKQTHLATH